MSVVEDPLVRLCPTFVFENEVVLVMASTLTFLAGSDADGTASIIDLVVLEDLPLSTVSVPDMAIS